ncbi:MAG: TIGR00282 family metallophosphoesterase [Chitinispirillaceae bacterium]|nr:TIGR00282 family metallophosphoesterase [Chitinispirillaceae bacterium]
MRLLFIGDIFGTAGRRICADRLPALLSERRIDVCIANGENAAGGRGLTGNLVKKLRKYGVQIVTGGNHSFSIPDNAFQFMEQPMVLRPHNYPPGNIGKGVTLFPLPDRRQLGVVNLQGRTFLHESLDCPFRTGLEAVEVLRRQTSCILVDFHAEATSEKAALARFLDGKVSAVIGTHTHVQTADERILEGGTAFITDAGMTGPEDSVIGMRHDQVIRRFLLQTYVPLEPSKKGAMLNAVVIDIDDATGHSRSIERIFERILFSHE